MSRYAENTSVPADRSRAEIERTLTRYGADEFMYGWQSGRAMVSFAVENRHVRFLLPLPDRHSPEFTKTGTGRDRSASAAESAYDQGVRQRWRALALVIKAKLEAVEAGIVTFDEEFLAHLMLPSGESVAEIVIPRLEEAYASSERPALLPS